MGHLAGEAQARVSRAFRPKTTKCYNMLFRIFVGFCVCSKMSLQSVSLVTILAYLEFLVKNNVSVNMVANHVSAIKAKFIMYDLQYVILDHPKVRYFIRSLKINRPLVQVKRNIMSLQVLQNLVRECNFIFAGKVFKAIFLMAFFGFLRISNLAPHAGKAFDPSRHLTPRDISFEPSCMRVIIKWSKTLQTRDRTHVLTLPRLRGSPLCPVKALKKAMAMYNPTGDQPLFQVYSAGRWQVIIDSRIRKVLSKLNSKLGFHPHHFSFHCFRRSGASLAYNSHMPIQKIKHHGSWTSDCVWKYIQADQNFSKDIAMSFVEVIRSAPTS